MSAEAIFVCDEPTDDELAGEVCDLSEQISLDTTRRMFRLSALFDRIGKDMLAKGQRTKTIGAFRYHVEEPQDREYCLCCSSLLYQCALGPEKRSGVFIRKDARPSFYLTRVKEKE